MLADGVAARVRLAQEKVLRGDQHAGRAVAALQRVALLEHGLQVRDLARVRQPLDCLDARALRLHGEHEAAAHDLAVEPDRARPAHSLLAADVRAGELKLLAQEVRQMSPRQDASLDGLAVHGEREVDERTHAASSASLGISSCTARWSSTRARWR